MKDLPDLPKSKITVKDGTVTRVEEWTLWNDMPSVTIEIHREPTGHFVSNIGNPEHGGYQARGSLEDVLERFHPTIQSQYMTLFKLQQADTRSINELDGFQRHEVVLQES